MSSLHVLFHFIWPHHPASAFLKKAFRLILKIFVEILSVRSTYAVLTSRQRHHECGESASGLYKWDIVQVEHKGTDYCSCNRSPSTRTDMRGIALLVQTSQADWPWTWWCVYCSSTGESPLCEIVNTGKTGELLTSCEWALRYWPRHHPARWWVPIFSLNSSLNEQLAGIAKNVIAHTTPPDPNAANKDAQLYQITAPQELVEKVGSPQSLNISSLIPFIRD